MYIIRILLRFYVKVCNFVYFLNKTMFIKSKIKNLHKLCNL